MKTIATKILVSISIGVAAALSMAAILEPAPQTQNDCDGSTACFVSGWTYGSFTTSVNQFATGECRCAGPVGNQDCLTKDCRVNIVVTPVPSPGESVFNTANGTCWDGNGQAPAGLSKTISVTACGSKSDVRWQLHSNTTCTSISDLWWTGRECSPSVCGTLACQ